LLHFSDNGPSGIFDSNVILENIEFDFLLIEIHYHRNNCEQDGYDHGK
jgi:hypothetical protein